MSSIPPEASELAAAVRRSVHEHWRMFLVEGIVLAVLGVAAIIVPPVAGLATTIFIGWMLVIGGAVGLYATFASRGAPGFVWSLLSGLAALFAGGVLLLYPVQGLVTLTYVLIAFFIVDGVISILLALEHRKELAGRWEWLVLSGIVSLVLAGLIVAGLPAAFSWALGLMVGIDLLFGGTSLIAMALAARKHAS